MTDAAGVMMCGAGEKYCRAGDEDEFGHSVQVKKGRDDTEERRLISVKGKNVLLNEHISMPSEEKRVLVFVKRRLNARS